MSKLHKILALTACCGFFCLNNVYADANSKQINQSNNTNISTSIQKHNKNAVQDKVSINKADAKVLEKVKFIGPKKAQAIVDYRNTNGEFKAISDLLNVKARGINKKWLEKITNNVSL